MDKNLRILMLEDSPADAELEEHELRKSGLQFTLKVVDTREAFLKELDEFFPDIILSDYDLPTFDGLAALRIAKEKCPDVPFILVTGKLGEEFAIDKLKEGATDYVLKGNLKRLVPSVRRALEEATMIADRKQWQEALKWKTAILEAQLNATIDGILIVDEKGNKVIQNQRCIDLWKIPQHIVDNRDDKQQVEFVMNRAKDPHKFVEKVIYLYTHPNETSQEELEFKDGTILDRYSAPVIGKDGKYFGRIWIFRDVTNRVRAAEALRASEEQLRAILDSTPFPLALVDVEGNNIVFWSRSALTLFGHTAPTATEWYQIAYPDPDYRSDVINRWKPSLEKARLSGQAVNTGEYRITCRDGSVRICELYATFLADRLIVTFNDITKRKRAEEALQESDWKLRSIIEYSSDRIFMLDKSRNYLLVNKSLANSLGKVPEEIIGKSINEVFAPEIAVQFSKNINKVFETAESILFEEKMTAQGQECFISTSLYPVIDDMRQVRAIAGIVRDITERKRAEEALEKRIVALTRPLDDTKGITFEELFNIDDIQRLQDEFARATGVASIIARPDGTPITAPSGFCRLCNDIIRKTEKGRVNCFRSDAEIGRPSAQGPTIQPCMSGGLWDAGAGISVGGRHIANWLIGQVRDTTQKEDKIRAYAKEIGADETAAAEAFREVPAMSREQFGQVAKVLFTLANQLSTTAYQNVQQARFITEHKQAEEALRASEAELHDNYFIQATINMILSESLENIPLNEFLQKSLNMILSIPWIALEPIGSISLVEDDADVLAMKAQSNIPEPLKNLCVQVPFGKCLCGKAAQSQKIVFADHIDEHHEICYEGMHPHGHYSVPILFGGKTLGVLNLYLKEGHIRDKKEEEFLHTVADTLAGIIVRKKAEYRVEYLAYYDGLTDLPNRNLFLDRLTQGIARAEYSKKLVAVLTMDIDRFKSINDTYGLDTGDAVLKAVAKRLTEIVREGDTTARIGGDGFGVLLIDIAQPEDIILVVEKVMKYVSQTIQCEGKELVLTISVGISVYPEDGKNASTLIKNAEMALARAKQHGRKNYQFYTEDMDIKASEFVRMEKNLFNAIQNEEFILYYQPYWDINTKKITGMEALVRWKSPEFGLVSPGKFIPVLEDTRMIIEVGEWILRTAIRQVKEWQNNGYPVVPVSVNLSPIQFRQRDIAMMIEKIIRENGFYSSLLTLEITESAFMQDIEFTHSVLESLKNIGVSISIDDFGTGYSSLAYLKRFPIDNLKIDISFIREITRDPDTASIVTAIINMAHTLNLKTIAEGIETEEQWKILRLLRCDMGQGFYLSKPLPAVEIDKLFHALTPDK